MDHQRVALVLCFASSLAFSQEVARVEAEKPFEAGGSVQVFGALAEILHNGDRSERVKLASLLPNERLYAIGALAGLRGEVTILGGVSYLSYPDGSEKIRTEKVPTTTEGAALLVAAQVAEWSTFHLSADLDFARLDTVLAEVAAFFGPSLREPFPFILEGEFYDLVWHAIDGSRLSEGAHEHADHLNAAVRALRKQARATLVGFYSTGHQGVFTHRGNRTHAHCIVEDPGSAGHVDGFTGVSRARLKLPRVAGLEPPLDYAALEPLVRREIAEFVRDQPSAEKSLQVLTAPIRQKSPLLEKEGVARLDFAGVHFVRALESGTSTESVTQAIVALRWSPKVALCGWGIRHTELRFTCIPASVITSVRLLAFDATGHPLWMADGSLDGHLFVSDIDGDGRAGELVYCSTAYEGTHPPQLFVHDLTKPAHPCMLALTFGAPAPRNADVIDPWFAPGLDLTCSFVRPLDGGPREFRVVDPAGAVDVFVFDSAARQWRPPNDQLNKQWRVEQDSQHQVRFEEFTAPK